MELHIQTGEFKPNFNVTSSPKPTAKEDSRKIVYVNGIQQGMSDDILSLFFENKRQSGGGDIESLNRNENCAYIKFEKAEGNIFVCNIK